MATKTITITGLVENKSIVLPATEEGMPLLPSAFKDGAGQPRFVLPLPREELRDVGVSYLITREAYFRGYEYPTRAFFDAHLEPGDLFIDVGAHFGVMTMSAATRHRGQVKVLAIEAYPRNVERLTNAILYNRLQDQVDVVAAAAGDKAGTAPLIANSTMGNSLYGIGLQGAKQKDIHLFVPVVTLDSLLEERQELQGRRCFLKIDVEGFEPQVIAGAQRLLEQGVVSALVWEKGRAFDTEPGLSAMNKMVQRIGSLGFSMHVFPSDDLGGPLLPFVPHKGSCNVFCLAPGFNAKSTYVRPFGEIPRPAVSARASGDANDRANLTAALAKVSGTDGSRWCDPTELECGADERAALAASYVRPGDNILDVGAGRMCLRQHLPHGTKYRPLDLIPFAADTLVADLNQGQYPAIQADLIVMLEVMEYLHDIPALLRWAAGAAPRLLCSYRCNNGEDSLTRRQQGWFNDFTENELLAHLEAAGWRVDSKKDGADTKLFVSERA